MAGTFVTGEQKIRPGSYFNIQKKGDNAVAGVVNGVTAVIFRSDFGPLCKAIELSAEDGYASTFGTGLTTDAMQEAINGGARTLIACRVGSGGTQAMIELNDKDGENAVIISALYLGNKVFTITIREKLTDTTVKECIIYDETTEFEKVEFTAGEREASALVEAFAASKNFKAQLKDGKESAIMLNVSQSVFQRGTNPQTKTEDYSNAFSEIESFECNSICVDTEDPAIHLLLLSFIKRVFNTGLLIQAVVAEKHTVDLDTRIAHAAAFNDEKMQYVLNAYVREQDKEIDGYQTAARVAGMIGACASNISLTHTVINGFTELLERLTNSQIIAAEKSGCLVLTYNNSKQIWIDNAINTLITPDADKDIGWKKIRRVKTRFELIRRMNETTDNLVGKIDNDQNGRNTVISQLQAVGNAMIAEGKLIAFNIRLSSIFPPDGDSAWFEYDVIDKDSMEHIYSSFIFQFNTNV